MFVGRHSPPAAGTTIPPAGHHELTGSALIM